MKVQSTTAAAILLLGGLSVLSPGCTSAKNDQPVPGSGVAPQVVPVETAAAEKSSLAVTREYTGSLEGEEQANIVAKIPERVMWIKAAVGLRVRKGQDIIGKHFYRPIDKDVLAQYSATLRPIELFPVTKIASGGWAGVNDKFFADGKIFDTIYKPK